MLRLLGVVFFVWMLGSSAWAESSLKFSGSSSVAPIVESLWKEYNLTHPGMAFELRKVGCEHGVRDVGNGKASIGMIARELSRHEEKLYSQLRLKAIAYDAVAFIVNDDNTVHELSDRQLRNVFIGKNDKWSKFSDKNGKIDLVSENSGRSGLKAMLDYLDLDASTRMSGAKRYMVYKKESADRYSKKMAMIVTSNEAMIEAVASNPDAIGYTSSVEALAAIRSGVAIKIIAIDGDYPSNSAIYSDRYPIHRTLSLVVDASMEPNVQNFVEFAQSYRGKEIIKTMGFPTKIRD